MSVTVKTFVNGPIENNTYLLLEKNCGVVAIVDPSSPVREIAEIITSHRYQLLFILVTHAHFDHIGGVKWFIQQFDISPKVVLHALDLELWNSGGGSKEFGFDFDAGIPPDLIAEDNRIINFGNTQIKVLHTPGHTPGHITYYLDKNNSAFCGDLIFYHGVGRSDLKYSDEDRLISSIHKKIFTLPDKTILYPGHGLSTSVLEEKTNNPFV